MPQSIFGNQKPKVAKNEIEQRFLDSVRIQQPKATQDTNREGVDEALLTGLQLSKGAAAAPNSQPVIGEQHSSQMRTYRANELRAGEGAHRQSGELLLDPNGQNPRGRRSSVRGVVDAISGRDRKFENPILQRLWESERDRAIVIYTTSLEAVRQTINDCSAVLQIFEILGLKVRVKDINLDPRFRREIEARASQVSRPGVGVGLQLPQVFINFEAVGGLADVVAMNDAGDLARMCTGFERRSKRKCLTCGGVGYVNCNWCQGSKRSRQHMFERGDLSKALMCTVCNENGLQLCPDCPD